MYSVPTTVFKVTFSPPNKTYISAIFYLFKQCNIASKCKTLSTYEINFHLNIGSDMRDMYMAIIFGIMYV